MRLSSEVSLPTVGVQWVNAPFEAAKLSVSCVSSVVIQNKSLEPGVSRFVCCDNSLLRIQITWSNIKGFNSCKACLRHWRAWLFEVYRCVGKFNCAREMVYFVRFLEIGTWRTGVMPDFLHGWDSHCRIRLWPRDNKGGAEGTTDPLIRNGRKREYARLSLDSWTSSVARGHPIRMGGISDGELPVK